MRPVRQYTEQKRHITAENKKNSIGTSMLHIIVKLLDPKDPNNTTSDGGYLEYLCMWLFYLLVAAYAICDIFGIDLF